MTKTKKLRQSALAACVAALALGANAFAADDVLRATLPNGLRVVIVPDRLAPVVTTEVNYLAGSEDAPAGFPGTAHATEHMMFRGSAGLDRDQLGELGSLLGGAYNADTTETVTQYFYEAPADDLGVVLKSESLRMEGASLKQADWAKERGAIEQEVSRDLSSPIYRYLMQLQAIMFAGTPYRHDALGTRPSFDATDAKLLRGFYDKWYAPNNAILVIAGDVEPQTALAQVRDAFGGLPTKILPAHPTFTLSPVRAQSLTLPTNFPVGLATLAFRMPGLSDHDFATAEILTDALTSQRAALYGMVPAGHALFSEFIYEPKADVGYGLAAAAFPKGGDPAPVIAEMRKILADTVKNGVSPALIEAARRQELAQLAFKTNSVTGLAAAWSQALAFQKANSPDDVAAAYRAVTVADVNRVARQILDPAHEVTAVLTPRNSGHPVMSGGYGGGESFAVAPDKPVPLPAWATAELSTLALPKAPTPPAVSVLPNGLRVIVQQEHVSPTVEVYGQVRQITQMQEPAGKDGVSDMVEELLGYGTSRLDRLHFQKALDDIAANEQAGTEFSLDVLTSQFEPGMKLLADNELHPAFLTPNFPADAFPIVRQELAQGLAGELQSPDYLYQRAITNARVPPGDPLRRQATPDTVMSLQPADVADFYHRTYRPDLTTIVVVGDVTPAEALRVVSRDFGGWTAAGPKPAIDLPPIGPSQTASIHVPDPSAVQDSVTLTEDLELPVANPDRFTLMLGNTILGGGFSSRLYRDLRIKSGYVYGVDSALDWTRTRGDYTVTFGSDPQNVAKARQLALQDIKEMQTDPVGDAELTMAKAQMLRKVAMQRDSTDAIAGVYLHETNLGLPLDTPQIAAEHYLAANATQIQDAFQKWIRPQDMAQVVKGPAIP